MSVVIFVQSAGALEPIGTYVRSYLIEPIGLEYVAAAAEERGHSVAVLAPQSLTREAFVRALRRERPDAVAFSVYSYALNSSLALARLAKQKLPGVRVVFGGYHPSADALVVEDDAVDFAILGEGETAICDLLDALDGKKDLAEVRGIAYKNNGQGVRIQGTAPTPDLESLPWPHRTTEMMEASKTFQISYPPPNLQQSLAQVVYSRGCPYSCRFCSSETIFGRQVRWRSPKNVVAEIEYLHRTYGTNIVFFADLTFNLNRDKVVALCDELIKADLPVHWWAMCRADTADYEVLEKMKTAGCMKVAFGIETADPAALSKVKPGKGLNATMNVLKAADAVGLLVRGLFMIGYPWETPESLDTISRFIRQAPLDEIRLAFFTPYPGTAYYQEMRDAGLLLTEDLDRFTAEEPVVRCQHISRNDLFAARDSIFRGFYESPEYQRRVMHKTSRHPHLASSYDGFYAFLERRAVLSEAVPA